ncbi:hypothetical protein AQUCO_07500031v1, partial [Aquilegia coerulea]
MPFFLVKRAVEKEWKLNGGLQITTNGKLYFFKFVDPEDRTKILEGGPIFVAGRIMVIRPWSEEVYEERQQISTVPIWVKCYDIPTQLWSREGLSLIGSRIGKPKCCDAMTMKMERLDFARICIEVSADTKYPTTLKFNLGEGKTTTIGVEYAWKPQCCVKCNVFGHLTRNCLNKQEANWVKKAQEVNQAHKEVSEALDKEEEVVSPLENVIALVTEDLVMALEGVREDTSNHALVAVEEVEPIEVVPCTLPEDSHIVE